MEPHRSYPHDLAERVRATWPPDGEALPACLEVVLDTTYHASFLRDEERPVTCRILVASPDVLDRTAGPPDALLPLLFREPRGFDEHEVRRLSPAAKYHRALIGVRFHAGRLETWGIVQSGTRWLQRTHGGGGTEPPMPASLIVRILRPGHIVVTCGTRLVAELRGGVVNDFTVDVFSSGWLPEMFAAERGEVVQLHARLAPERASERARTIAQEMVKRVIATMLAAHHGGTVLVLPPSCAAERFLTTKYSFADEEPRRHFRRTVHAILESLEARRGADHQEALFELSHLIAALAEVDGAVVLTRRFEILGFGAEISGDLPTVAQVRRALDLEAKHVVVEAIDRVGTRHRSAYRLCAALPGALAVVVSQDGGVRFITRREEGVTYWDHGAGDS
jgi:DisA bacterial checkpoint controller nucleotide-binding